MRHTKFLPPLRVYSDSEKIAIFHALGFDCYATISGRGEGMNGIHVPPIPPVMSLLNYPLGNFSPCSLEFNLSLQESRGSLYIQLNESSCSESLLRMVGYKISATY